LQSNLQLGLASKAKRCGPSHVYFIVGFSPLNKQVTTGQCHTHSIARTTVVAESSWDLARSHGGHGERTRSGTAGQGWSRTTLPYLHAQVIVGYDLDKLDIGPDDESEPEEEDDVDDDVDDDDVLVEEEDDDEDDDDTDTSPSS
jgi:hypothetical protein